MVDNITKHTLYPIPKLCNNCLLKEQMLGRFLMLFL